MYIFTQIGPVTSSATSRCAALFLIVAGASDESRFLNPANRNLSSGRAHLSPALVVGPTCKVWCPPAHKMCYFCKLGDGISLMKCVRTGLVGHELQSVGQIFPQSSARGV